MSFGAWNLADRQTRVAAIFLAALFTLFYALSLSVALFSLSLYKNIYIYANVWGSLTCCHIYTLCLPLWLLLSLLLVSIIVCQLSFAEMPECPIDWLTVPTLGDAVLCWAVLICALTAIHKLSTPFAQLQPAGAIWNSTSTHTHTRIRTHTSTHTHANTRFVLSTIGGILCDRLQSHNKCCLLDLCNKSR